MKLTASFKVNIDNILIRGDRSRLDKQFQLVAGKNDLTRVRLFVH